MRSKQQQGLSLTEMAIVLFIVGIISSIAWSSYDKQRIKANRNDAVTSLMKVADVMERCYQDNIPNSYASCSLPADTSGVLCFKVINITCPAAGLSVISPMGYYTISIASQSTDDYSLMAAPIAGGPQDGDTNLTLDSKGNKTGPWPK